MRNAVWSVAIGAGLLLYWWNNRSVSPPPGVLVNEVPEQTALPGPAEPWRVEGYSISPLAKFHVRARVLSAERYRFDAGAELSPIDLALGWGAMSDTAVLDRLSISQGSRFYYYQWRNQPPVPVGEIISSSSNMHLIPASSEIRRELTSVRVGQIVDLLGYLVRADGPNGWKWVSSLSRNDTGNGACELVWVESVTAE